MFNTYIFIFTCATSRAVILDLVKNGSSKKLKKKMKRRDWPKTIVSDNGTVFNHLFCGERGIILNLKA